jgi:hypothetical protein
MLAVGALACLAGCVERRLTVTTDPPGALVYVSDTEVGRSPVTIPFTYYGDYDIILRLEGRETLKTHANLTPPWYQVIPLDLLSEVAPWTTYDRRYVHYELTPASLPGEEEFIRRAREMRRRNLLPPDDPAAGEGIPEGP